MSTDKIDEESSPEDFVLTTGGERLIGASSEEREFLGELYEAHDKLKIDPEKNKDSYQKLLDATKQGKKAKVLAARFIPMFFKHFPTLGATSIDALLDLVEDEDKQVRMSTIQYLPDICEGNKRYVIEIANVLGQLLVGCESEVELGHVEKSLEKLLKSDFSATIDAMFEHVGNGFKNPEKEEVSESEASAKELAGRLSQKSLQFIIDKVTRNRRKYAESLTAEVEQAIKEKILPLLEVCDPKTFDNLIMLLRRLKIHKASDVETYSDLVQTVMQKSNLHTLAQSFEPTQKDQLRKLLTCMKMSFPLYKKDFTNEKFLRFLMMKVIPQISALNDDLLSLEILHTLAEMSEFTSADVARKMISRIYDGLVSQLPDAAGEGEENEPVVNFSYLEAFLVIFHHIAHKVPGLLNRICGISVYTGQPNEVDEEDHSEKRLVLNAKLQYSINKATEFREANLQQLMKVANPNESNEARRNRMKTSRVITNVIELGKNLKLDQPRFGFEIKYSWKVSGAGGKKRNRRKMKDQKSGRKRKPENAVARGAPQRKKNKPNPPPRRRFQQGNRRNMGRSRPPQQERQMNRPPNRRRPLPPQRRNVPPQRRRPPGGPSGGVAEMGRRRNVGRSGRDGRF